ncbi:mitochondrial ribosomal subunit protein-domain-containing protein [Durotheca rogersii]|uniref:mitochondrial ribosomal subunit protein-domain-containing protein n=1 Tax=Durotheca rogersii TaxID=419775 RepID=UPI00221ECC31|nr:mitochondrial ribosomal subunit protein-domain-containing protein [Durotheca rogersii]KAI5860146.1 mitochondrial ribosomal subunit protein-domain-containing protein [Durotheca rogersii]
MASGARSIRLCLRSVRPAPIPPRVGGRAHVSRRALSWTSARWYPPTEGDNGEGPHQGGAEGANTGGHQGDASSQTRAQASAEDRSAPSRRSGPDNDELARMNDRALADANNIMLKATTPPKIDLRRSFWSEDEEEPDLITDERTDEQFDEDDIMSLAHGKLEEFREFREYARIAAWEMPLLSKLAVPFAPPTAQEPLRFRYTSYMGEFHPAENKVVVEFSPRDLPLDEAQKLKLKKLLGSRYNPETDIAKMSCEQFEHQAQNKRYLSDLVDKLIVEAKDTTDTFEDVPLDTRHHRFKIKPKFPREWRMSDERRRFLADTRQQSLLLDERKEAEGTLIDGKEKLEQFFNPQEAEEQLPEYARAGLLQGTPKSTRLRF